MQPKLKSPHGARDARKLPVTLALAGLCVAYLAIACPATAAAPAPEVAPEYKTGPASPDWLVEELQLRPGMAVADIGAGSGYLERRLAPLLPQGKIYAVDVQPEMIELLRDLARQPDTRNVVPVLGSAADVRLAAASVDLAVMVDVYHELAYPAEIIRSLLRSLRPGGRLVFVEYRAEDPAVAIKPLHKMSVAQIRREMQDFPVVWERTSERLPVQHIVVFRKL